MGLIETFYNKLIEELDRFASKRGFKRIDDATWIGDVDGMVVKVKAEKISGVCRVEVVVPNTGCYHEWMVVIEVYQSIIRGIDIRYKVDICSHWFEEGKWTTLITLAVTIDEVVSEALVKAYKEVGV